MQKIKKNLSAIEQKFQTLKQAQKNNGIPVKIGQVAQIMTYGVINQNQVNDYLESTKNESGNFINENWLDVSIQSMILFFDKVIKHRNSKKAKQGAEKQRRNILSWEKVKTKMSNKEAHQNPYRPQRFGKQIKQTETFDPDYTSGTLNFGSEGNVLSHIKQNPNESIASELQEEELCELMDAMNADLPEKLKQKSQKFIQQQLNFDLPRDFQSFPLDERFIFLRTSYNKSKAQLQKKFDMIYTHYRKEMYIRHETFKANEDLMLDLKTFLKYYRDFQIAKKYKTNQATNYFKKLAKNGIWLDPLNFSKLHYLLAQIMFNTDEKEIQQRLSIQNTKKNNQMDFQSQELKRLLSKSTKTIMQNMAKLKDLVFLISDEKVKKLLNDNRGRGVINKIVEIHSGFVKEDIFERLKQRVDQKKKNKQIAASKSGNVTFRAKTLQKSPSIQEKYKQIKPNPSYLSIYRQLLIPTLPTAEMKKASIYSSLQLLSIHKEKEKLRELLITEEDDEKYLEAYFKKQKLFQSLSKSNNPIKSQSQHEINNYKTTAPKSQRKQTNVKKTLSLPRMKFT